MKHFNPLFSLLLFVMLFSCSKETVQTPSEETPALNQDPETPSAEEETIEILSNIPCESGKAGDFPCAGFDLIAHVPSGLFGNKDGNDSWGWTDPDSGKEYAIMGVTDATYFLDISQPDAPVILGHLPTATDDSPWRDIKVFKNHAFIVSEADGHGLQVFDLTKLRTATSNQVFKADARITDFGNAHNIAINEDTGFAYVIGAQLFDGGPIFIDINEPKSPKVVGGYEADSYTHDAQIVTYQGPDTDYVGREIFIGSNSVGGENNQVVFVDVTDKKNPVKISTFTYSNGGYTHQAWLTEDQRYLIMGDELDEIMRGIKTHSRIIDVSNLDAPVLHVDYFGPTAAIDHNGYVKGKTYYIANYTSGMRAVDISQIEEKNFNEIGYFDTYPQNDKTVFAGAWNVYPFFESGLILISDINSGLFLVKSQAE